MVKIQFIYKYSMQVIEYLNNPDHFKIRYPKKSFGTVTQLPLRTQKNRLNYRWQATLTPALQRLAFSRHYLFTKEMHQ